MIRVLLILILGLAAARAEWQLLPGYRIEEYAREPRIVDPIAMDWDDRGRVYVLESGRIKVLDGEAKVIAGDLSGATGFAIK